MLVTRKSKRRAPQAPKTNTEMNSDDGKPSLGYEQFRDQKIKENMQRMQKLGILDLSVKLKAELVGSKRPRRDPTVKIPPQSTPGSPRRSSRLKSVAPISYSEVREKKKNSERKKEIRLQEGLKPEIYTEEHEKLLGDCKTTWTLCVDGYGADGKRIYDPVNGKTCHQCRQKTLGHHTQCIKCDLVQGQFCGDCLYMRYGENVIEANRDPNWICPVCRGICNCSLCRQAKGWVPTGNLYRKVMALGYKSVAHYLIHTRRSQTNTEDTGDDNSPSTEDELLHSDKDPDGLPLPESDISKENDVLEETEEAVALDSGSSNENAADIDDKSREEEEDKP